MRISRVRCSVTVSQFSLPISPRGMQVLLGHLLPPSLFLLSTLKVGPLVQFGDCSYTKFQWDSSAPTFCSRSPTVLRADIRAAGMRGGPSHEVIHPTSECPWCGSASTGPLVSHGSGCQGASGCQGDTAVSVLSASNELGVRILGFSCFCRTANSCPRSLALSFSL